MKQTIENQVNVKIESLIRSWDAEVQWTPQELFIITKKLKRMAESNHGPIHSDEPIESEVAMEFILNSIGESMQKVLRMYASSLFRVEGNDYYYVDNDSMRKVKERFKFIQPMKYKESIDINLIKKDALENLPGIGKTTAQRIIDYRMRVGYIRSLEELRAIKGISTKNIDQFKYYVSINPASNVFPFIPLTMSQFIEDPIFINYLKLIKDVKGVFSTYHFPFDMKYLINEGLSNKQLIVYELNKMLKLLSENQFNEFLFYCRATDVNILNKAEVITRDIQQNSITDISGVSILDDIQYMFFLRDSLKKAKKKISVIMFFMRYDEEKKYPVNEFIDELIKAHKRGLEVRVILDRDAEADVYQSRIINKEAYDHLKENGVMVVHDSELYVTHSKIALIDDIHTIIGSHNWTAGSFYAYDDKSVYVESERFNKQISDYFDDLWNKYRGIVYIKDIRIIKAAVKKRLDNLEISTSKQLLQILKTKKDRKKMAKELKMKEEELFTLANIIDLMRIDGINEEWAYLLEKVGVDTLAELKLRNPENLFKSMTEYLLRKADAEIVTRKPSTHQIEYWIRKAKQSKKVLSY